MASHRRRWRPRTAPRSGWSAIPQAAVAGASALYTDVWISMGQQHDAAKIEALRPYQLNARLLGQGPSGRHRPALPAGASGRGDHRRGHGRSAVGGVRPGGEPAARAEGAHGLPDRRACRVNKRQRQQIIRRVLQEPARRQPAGARGRAGGRRLRGDPGDGQPRSAGDRPAEGRDPAGGCATCSCPARRSVRIRRRPAGGC